MGASTTRTARQPRLLWLDLSLCGDARTGPELFTAHCQVQRYILDRHQGSLDSLPDVDMLCLQFDAPDTASLNRLVEIRQRFPHLPITMLTVQHSEALAVWAFRSGVWDYLTLPLSHDEYRRYLDALKTLCERRTHTPPDRSTTRTPPPLSLPLPLPLPEVARLTRDPSYQQPLYTALKHIDDHYRERIREEDMARLCNMSPSHFSRLFKRQYGVSFQDYLKQKRMQAASDLLLNSNVAVSGVGYLLGFRDPSYFTRSFRQFFGCSPSAYRQQAACKAAPAAQPDEQDC